MGANIGTIAIPAAQIIRQFGFGSVTAVEAVPLHVLLLRKSMKQNRIENVLVFRHAISDKPGLDIELTTSSLDNRGRTFAHRKSQVVSAVSITIDQIYEMYPQRLKNTLIWKMDIECYEGYAFTGALKFLDEVRPCWIVVELFEKCLKNNGSMKYREIINLLEKLGYQRDTLMNTEEHIFRHDDCCMKNQSCIFK